MSEQSQTFQPDAANTHEVLNQPTPFENYNAWQSDQVLQHWVNAFEGDWGEASLSEYGQKVGHELLHAGFAANKFKPEFHPHNRFGHRVDLVEYHPAYHELMAAAINAGHHSIPWEEAKMGAHVVRAGIEFLHSQADPGSGCPLTMTFASVPALRHQPDLAKTWLPKISARHYDSRNVPFFEKDGLTIGMAMTEKQGGSDVRANTSVARQIAVENDVPCYEILGHKWFCSAPMCDGFLVLAHAPGGLSCFLMPRWKPDGSKNPMQIQRLKNKVGNVSNASSEVEFRGAFAWLVGEEGKGVKTILEMVALTRFDCMVGSSSIMSLAVQQALHHTGGRMAFGKNLHDQPLMQNVLADMALEAEAALAISMRMANALDNQEHDLVRLGTAIGKYWVCKRAPQLTYEAMESIGAVGLIADNVVSRLYTESPVNAIWEGSGNIQCLDVLRAIEKEPQSLQAFKQELASALSLDGNYANYVTALEGDFSDPATLELRARTLVEKMALAWQASVLLRFGDKQIAQAFIASRLIQPHGQMYGTLPADIDFRYIIDRAKPQFK